MLISGPRRRHRRLAAVLDPGRRDPVGDRAGRDPADAAAQRPALAHRRAGRRAAQDRPRRGDRGAARRRRVRLLDRAADRVGLHHDARLPPQHLPGGDRHAGPRAAGALQGHARARDRTSSMFVAEEVRSIMASLGVRRFEEMIGRVELLETAEAIDHWKARGRRPVAGPAPPRGPADVPRRRRRARRAGARRRARLGADRAVRAGDRARRAGARRPIPIRNINRDVGGILSGEIARRHGAAACRRTRSSSTFSGSAGQSFGAWLAPGVTFTLQRRGQRLRRQGAVRRDRRRAPARDGAVSGRGEHDRRQHRAVRRDRGARVLPRPRGRALRGAQLRRAARSWRASATTAAST